MSRDGRRFAIAAWVSAAGCAAFLAWVLFGFGGTTATVVVDDLGELVAAAAAAVACGWRARRSAGRGRYWALLGASAAAWAVGEAVWSWYEIGLGREVPFPSWADAGFLFAVPLAVVALLAFPSAPRTASARLRSLFDGALMATSLLFVSWAVVLGPLYRAGEGSTLEQVLSLAYPAGDVVTVIVLFAVVARARRHTRPALALVGAGIVAIAVADSAFAYLTSTGSFGSGNVLDAGWVVGYLLIALGALWPAAADAPHEEEAPYGRLRILFPYVPVVAAIAVAGVHGSLGRDFGPMLRWNGLALLALLGGRQLLALLENASLSGQLAAKVELRSAQLRQREARFSALVQKSSDVIAIVSVDGAITYQSPSVRHLLGWDADELVGGNLLDLVHPDELSVWQAALAQVADQPGGGTDVEWHLVHRDGSLVAVATRITNLLHDQSVAGMVLNSRDISDRKALENQLRHQAFHDPLTGLANRALFQNRLEHALDRRGGEGSPLVLFIDVDNFKAVNDGRGHAVGDELLQAVAARLLQYVRTADTVARLGGDEFGVLLDRPDDGLRGRAAAERILSAFTTPFDVGGEDMFVYASIGIAAPVTGQEDAGELLRNADVAMYAAKAAGKGRSEVFHAGMHDAVIAKLQLEADLRRAVEHNEFVVYYQPIIDVESGRTVGAEALVRWIHPHRGLVPPLDFIPAAEATGLIVPIGEQILRTACTDMVDCNDLETGEPLRLSVNLSARQLDEADLVERIDRILYETRFDARRLTLEITESVVIADPELAISRLHALKQLGVTLAIDDFGTGYSSLSYLQRLPVDELKIDRAFVSAMADSEESANLVGTIVRLAHDFHMKTVAEGVEERGELAELSGLHCDLAQGFYFSRPVPISQLRASLYHAPAYVPALT